MNRIIKIGIDVYSKNYTLCTMEPTKSDRKIMRDDHKLALKKLKQQINAFVLRHGLDKMDHQACHLGLALGQHSSSNKVNRLGISKAGYIHLRRRKYYKITRHGKKKNVAVTAVARELACFVWGMMTGNICIVSAEGTPVSAVCQG